MKVTTWFVSSIAGICMLSQMLGGQTDGRINLLAPQADASQGVSAGTSITISGTPAYQKPTSYNSSVTTTFEGEKYTIQVAIVTIPTGSGFQKPMLETQSNAIYIARPDELKAIFGEDTAFAAGAVPASANKPVAATIELLGDNAKGTSGPDGMHIDFDMLTGQMNLGRGLAVDVEFFDRKIVLKPGSINLGGTQYTFSEGACIVAVRGKLTAYGVTRH